MSLPRDHIEWPPGPFHGVQKKYKEWAAWYGGEQDKLSGQYSGASVQIGGGSVFKRVARYFWGTPPSAGSTTSSKLHIPLAEEIAAEGSYQLFKNPPRIHTDSKPHQARIDEYIKEGLFIQLLEAAEVSSALSGVYLRVGYDLDLSDVPLVSIHHPDMAVPTFYYGHLTECVLHRVLLEDSGKVIRHLETHTPGLIEHGLFVGDPKNLGAQAALDTRPETEFLEPQVEGPIPRGLDVIYIPNLKTRIWRDNGQAANLGRSDFGSVISVMDALDEAFTSWMRDVRLGKSRLLVPQQYLSTEGRGKGASLDLEKDVFVELNVLASKDRMEITPNQFHIRFQEHSATCTALTERAISGAGYSAQTFGLTGDVAMTATEANSRERRTFDTRSAKVEVWERKIRQLILLMLQIDARNGKVAPFAETSDTEITVEFPPPVQENKKILAETAQLLRNAEAASTEVLVRLVNPEWDDERVLEEVDKIIGEAPEPDPAPIVVPPLNDPSLNGLPVVPPIPVGA
jgi:hypothetical protein